MNIDLGKSAAYLESLLGFVSIHGSDRMPVGVGRRAVCQLLLLGGTGLLLTPGCGRTNPAETTLRVGTVDQIIKGQIDEKDIVTSGAPDPMEREDIRQVLELMKANFQEERLGKRLSSTESPNMGNLEGWLERRTKVDNLTSKNKRVAGATGGTGVFVSPYGVEMRVNNWLLAYDGPYGAPVYSRIKGSWNSSAIYGANQDQSVMDQRQLFSIFPTELEKSYARYHNQGAEYVLAFPFRHQGLYGKFDLESEGKVGSAGYENRFRLVLASETRMLGID